MIRRDESERVCRDGRPNHATIVVPSIVIRSLTAALDVVLPPLCMACRTTVGAPGRLCPECWAAVDFIAAPFCHRCGLPFAYDTGPGAVCAACASASPPFDRARAAVRYGDTARRLVGGFKYGDRTHLAPALAKLLLRPGAALLEDADLLVPVPLHPRRLIARRFNQSAMLARALSMLCRVAVSTDALTRHRATPAQAGLGREGRARNVAGAFRVPSRQRAGIAGRHIVLIDDVLTTGATANACARALRRADAERIDVLTLARVVSAD